MRSFADEYDLLLSAPNPIEAELARSALAAHGIPSITHGFDRDAAELGSSVNSLFTRPNLYVPKGARERAQAILDEVMGEPLPDEGPPPPPDANAPEWSSDAASVSAPGPGHSSASLWFLAVVLVAVLVFVGWLAVR